MRSAPDGPDTVPIMNMSLVFAVVKGAAALKIGFGRWARNQGQVIKLFEEVAV